MGGQRAAGRDRCSRDTPPLQAGGAAAGARTTHAGPSRRAQGPAARRAWLQHAWPGRSQGPAARRAQTGSCALAAPRTRGPAAATQAGARRNGHARTKGRRSGGTTPAGLAGPAAGCTGLSRRGQVSQGAGRSRRARAGLAGRALQGRRRLCAGHCLAGLFLAGSLAGGAGCAVGAWAQVLQVGRGTCACRDSRDGDWRLQVLFGCRPGPWACPRRASVASAPWRSAEAGAPAPSQVRGLRDAAQPAAALAGWHGMHVQVASAGGGSVRRSRHMRCRLQVAGTGRDRHGVFEGQLSLFPSPLAPLWRVAVPPRISPRRRQAATRFFRTTTSWTNDPSRCHMASGSCVRSSNEACPVGLGGRGRQVPVAFRQVALFVMYGRPLRQVALFGRSPSSARTEGSSNVCRGRCVPLARFPAQPAVPYGYTATKLNGETAKSVGTSTSATCSGCSISSSPVSALSTPLAHCAGKSRHTMQQQQQRLGTRALPHAAPRLFSLAPRAFLVEERASATEPSGHGARKPADIKDAILMQGARPGLSLMCTCMVNKCHILPLPAPTSMANLGGWGRGGAGRVDGRACAG